MDKRLLDILCCPVSKLPVRLANKTQLDALNTAIATGQIRTAAGANVTQALQAALISSDGRVLYRIEDDIPVMLEDEAIGTTQLQNFPI